MAGRGVIVSKENRFLIYCIEEYKFAKKLNGQETWKLFEEKGLIEYICKFYESLHTTSSQNIIADIDEFLMAAA